MDLEFILNRLLQGAENARIEKKQADDAFNVEKTRQHLQEFIKNAEIYQKILADTGKERGLSISWVPACYAGGWDGNIALCHQDLFGYDINYKSHQKILDELLICTDWTPKITMRLETHIDNPSGKCDQLVNYCFHAEEPRLKSILEINNDNFDFATMLPKDTIDRLLDGAGSVSLLDFHPRVVPKGYTPEYFCVRAARISLGSGLKDIKTDTGLLRYLFTNKHTSPLEMCNVTLALKVPIAIAVHFLRHRTGKFNQFSQRYAEIPPTLETYNPLNYKYGIRVQGGLNKQAGQQPDGENLEKISELMKIANDHQRAIESLYHQMIQETKVASEVARFWLPSSQYTMLIMQFDLNNLIKLLRLRIDKAHAQRETADYTEAIYELCKPLFPTIFAAFDEERFGLGLTKKEVDAFATQQPNLDSTSKTEKEEFSRKVKRLRNE